MGRTEGKKKGHMERQGSHTSCKSLTQDPGIRELWAAGGRGGKEGKGGAQVSWSPGARMGAESLGNPRRRITSVSHALSPMGPPTFTEQH